MSALNLIAAPSWLIRALMNARLDIKALLNIPKLSSTLSKDDVDFYIYCQDLLAVTFPKDILKDFHLPYRDTVVSEDTYDGRAQEVLRLNNPDNSITPLFDGVVDRSEPVQTYVNYIPEFFEIEVNVIGVQLKEIDKNESYEAQMLRSYQKLISLMHLYMSFEEIARTGVFREFVRLKRVLP